MTDPIIKLKKSSVKDKAPTTLAEGELAVNFNEGSPALYVQDTAGNVIKLADANTAADGKVASITGTAPIVVDNGDPLNPVIEFEIDKYVEVAGDNMTGDLTLGTNKITLDATGGGATFKGDVAIGDSTTFRGTLGDAVALLPPTIAEQFKTIISSLPVAQPFAGDATTLPSNIPTPLKDALVRVTTAGKINLNASGSAAFLGFVNVGSSSHTAIGVQATNNSTATPALWLQNTNGSTGPLLQGWNSGSKSVEVFNNGSADFSGYITSGSSVENGQFKATCPASITPADAGAFLVTHPSVGNAIQMRFDGSSSFAGKVTSASTSGGDSGTTLATKDYVDNNSGSGGSPGNGTITVIQPGTSNQTFTVNQSGDAIITLKNDNTQRDISTLQEVTTAGSATTTGASFAGFVNVGGSSHTAIGVQATNNSTTVPSLWLQNTNGSTGPLLQGWNSGSKSVEIFNNGAATFNGLTTHGGGIKLTGGNSGTIGNGVIQNNGQHGVSLIGENALIANFHKGGIGLGNPGSATADVHFRNDHTNANASGLLITKPGTGDGTGMYGIYCQPHPDDGTSSSVTGINVQTPTAGTGRTVNGNIYGAIVQQGLGLYVGSGKSYGFYSDLNTNGNRENHNFYAGGNAPNYFKGNITCDGLINGAFSLRMQTDDPSAFTTTLAFDEEGDEVNNSVYNGTSEDLLSIIKDLRARVAALEAAAPGTIRKKK